MPATSQTSFSFWKANQQLWHNGLSCKPVGTPYSPMEDSELMTDKFWDAMSLLDLAQ